MTFECASNESKYLLLEAYPLVMSSVSTSTKMVSLNLTATSEVNGTNVTCNATTGPNTNLTEPAYLYVQGQYTKCTYLIFIIDRST